VPLFDRPFPDNDGWQDDGSAGPGPDLVQEQAREIIAAVLAGTDPEGAEVRARLREHVAAHPGQPEVALHEHLIFTRSLVRYANDEPKPKAVDGSQHPAANQNGVAGQDQATLEKVIHGGMLVTAFQPIHDLAHGGVVGAEALTRFVWEDGNNAGAWFRNAAALGLGPDLEFSALKTAIAAAQELPQHLFVALNVSPAICLHPKLPELLDNAPLEPSRLVLELTDPLQRDQMDPVLEVLTPLRRSGLHLAVDQAGANAVSMRNIRALRPDIIKIGRDLIAGIDRDPSRQYLVADLVEFAKHTGADVAAVGIETASELAVLTRLAVAAGQGHFLGRPTIDTKERATWSSHATTQTKNPRGRRRAQQPPGQETR
jgi:EAL domain-containing protein (putative c-di-GMP-specific phosphodiesterase class I)